MSTPNTTEEPSTPLSTGNSHKHSTMKVDSPHRGEQNGINSSEKQRDAKESSNSAPQTTSSTSSQQPDLSSSPKLKFSGRIKNSSPVRVNSQGFAKLVSFIPKEQGAQPSVPQSELTSSFKLKSLQGDAAKKVKKSVKKKRIERSNQSAPQVTPKVVANAPEHPSAEPDLILPLPTKPFFAELPVTDVAPNQPEKSDTKVQSPTKTKAKRGSMPPGQVLCCIKNCENKIKSRTRFSLKYPCEWKDDFIEMGWEKICCNHYWADRNERKRRAKLAEKVKQPQQDTQDGTTSKKRKRQTDIPTSKPGADTFNNVNRDSNSVHSNSFMPLHVHPPLFPKPTTFVYSIPDAPTLPTPTPAMSMQRSSIFTIATPQARPRGSPTTQYSTPPPPRINVIHSTSGIVPAVDLHAQISMPRNSAGPSLLIRNAPIMPGASTSISEPPPLPAPDLQQPPKVPEVEPVYSEWFALTLLANEAVKRGLKRPGEEEPAVAARPKKKKRTSASSKKKKKKVSKAHENDVTGALLRAATTERDSSRQQDCCVKGCNNPIKKRTRFSLRCKTEADFKEEYLLKEWQMICEACYFRDLYRSRKK